MRWFNVKTPDAWKVLGNVIVIDSHPHQLLSTRHAYTSGGVDYNPSGFYWVDLKQAYYWDRNQVVTLKDASLDVLICDPALTSVTAGKFGEKVWESKMEIHTGYFFI